MKKDSITLEQYCKENNMEYLLSEWDYEKNGDLKPSGVTSQSNKKVWWHCEKGHKWIAQIYNRTNGSNCPYCCNRQLLKGFNDLETKFSKISKEWHPTKNGDLKPSQVLYGSAKKVWWQCEKGHEWDAIIEKRTCKNGSNCPYCTNRKLLKGFNDLETKFSKIAKEWHSTKNGDLKPNQVLYGSGKKVWWQCEKGHEWETTIDNRIQDNGTNCPYCCNRQLLKGFNDLETKFSKISKEWHPTKNGDLKPSQVPYGSAKKVWWQCEKGHEWDAIIEKRTCKNGSNCPYCVNQKVLKGFNDLETKFSKIAKEWHPTKNGNLKPSQIAAKSGKKVWWQCNKGHEWETKISMRTKTNGTNCPICNQGNQISFPEKTVYYYIKQVFDDALGNNKPTWLNRKELDIYIPELQLAIEYDGQAYHNTKESKIKDEEKNRLCKKNKIFLIRVRELKCKKLKNTKGVLVLKQKANKNNSLKENIYKIFNHIKHMKKLNINFPIIDIEKDSIKINNLIERQELENSLETLYPEIAAQWHPSLNGKLKSNQFTFRSPKKFWWKCEKGHKWISSIANRTNGKKCPICSGHKVLKGYNDLETKYPNIAKEWHPIKNGELKPSKVVCGNNTKFWWKCSHCGYEYERVICQQIKAKTKCTHCKDNKQSLKQYRELIIVDFWNNEVSLKL